MDLYSQWYQAVEPAVQQKAKTIKLLICDIDGVFSDGSVILGNSGEEMKAFNTKDGFGIKALMNAGVEVAVITGRKSTLLENRMKGLGVNHIYQGMENKIIGYNELLKNLNLTHEQVAYIGDDVPDVPVMQLVNLAVSVNDAHPYVKSISDLVTVTNGGRGAVRELTDFIIMMQKGEEYLITHFEGTSA